MKVHWVQLTLSIIWQEKSVSPAVHFICVQISTLILCCYFLDGLNTLDFINHMTWQISFPCGALYLHFIRCCSWLYALNLVDFVNDMAWKISFPCGALYLHLFILCLMLLLFRCIESGWLYQLYDMTDQFSLWCTLFGLHFICSARSTTKLTGRNRKHPHYLPICQGNCILFHILQR